MKVQFDQRPYAIIGNGRVAKHFVHYFNLLHIPFYHWWRNGSNDLIPIAHHSDRLLLLISDSAIVPFINEHPELQSKKLIHFSGALVLDDIASAHPLTSFSTELFDLAFYKNIPFFIEAEGPAFSEILPGLPNSAYSIPKALKPLYHGLCVLSGNFTTLLWQKFFDEFNKKFHLPKHIAFPYMQSIIHNLQQQKENVLTGPLARNDKFTIEKNLQALSNDPYAEVYRAFVKAYQETYHERS